jgi:hypothetical protein
LVTTYLASGLLQPAGGRACRCGRVGGDLVAGLGGIRLAASPNLSDSREVLPVSVPGSAAGEARAIFESVGRRAREHALAMAAGATRWRGQPRCPVAAVAAED